MGGANKKEPEVTPEDVERVERWCEDSAVSLSCQQEESLALEFARTRAAEREMLFAKRVIWTGKKPAGRPVPFHDGRLDRADLDRRVISPSRPRGPQG